jgi:hypothetical protein
MSDYQTKNGDLEEIDLPDEPLTDSELKAEHTIERLDSFFAGLSPGVSLLVERLRPSWCSGVLEEFTVDDPIGLDYFIEQWGGELLLVKVRGKGGKLRGSYKIPLHSFPPLLYGDQIKQPNRGDRFREDSPAAAPTPSPSIVQTGFPTEKIMAAASGLAPVLMQWMKSQEDRRRAEEDRRREDMQMMLAMMKSNQGGGLSDITKVGAVMAQLNEMFKQNAPVGGGSEMDFLPHALDVLKTVMGSQPASREQPKARITPPAPSLSSGPPSRQRATVTPLPVREGEDVSSQIAKMEPARAVESVLEALGKMDPDKRDAVIGTFLMKYQEDMSGDDGAIEDEDDQNPPRGYMNR